MRIEAATLSVTLLLCAGCGKRESAHVQRQAVQQSTSQHDEAITPEIVSHSELIVVGQFGVTTATGTVNSHILVEQTLHGNLQEGRKLVVVYRTSRERLDRSLTYIFCLKSFEVEAEKPQRQYMQFLGPNLYGLVESTETNVARVRKLLAKK
jgi:hypothetical protein